MSPNFFSFITVSHGHFEDICELIKSIDKYWGDKCELIVVDNKNEDFFTEDTLNNICKNGLLKVRLFRQFKYKSFSENNNFGVMNATYSNIFIINPDVKFFSRDFFNKYGGMDVKQVVYPKLLNSDFSIQHHYNQWPDFLGQSIRFINYKIGKPMVNINNKKDWFFAAAIIINKKDFISIDGFNEYYPLYCEDVDFYHKLQCKKLDVKYDEDVQLIHNLGGDSKGKYLSKAIYSNMIWRFFKIKNAISYK